MYFEDFILIGTFQMNQLWYFCRICVLPLLRSIPLHWMAWFRCSYNHSFNHCSGQGCAQNSCFQEQTRENIGPLLSRSRKNRNFRCPVSVYGDIGRENSRIQKTTACDKAWWAWGIGDWHFQSRVYAEKTEMWNGKFLEVNTYCPPVLFEVHMQITKSQIFWIYFSQVQSLAQYEFLHKCVVAYAKEVEAAWENGETVTYCSSYITSWRFFVAQYLLLWGFLSYFKLL